MVKNLRSGFTLAEVLTTLMVIGVVAAMTIPTLLNSTDDQQKKVALKKAASVLGQGVQLSVAKEIECDVTDSATLASCMAKLISGTPQQSSESVTKDGTTEIKGNGDKDMIVTPDGLAFKFIYDGSNTTKNLSRNLITICGEGNVTGADGKNTGVFQNTKESWAGKGAHCAVIVDVNGIGKGTKHFQPGTTLKTKIGANGGADDSVIAGDDQFMLIFTGDGIRPAFWDKSKAGDDKTASAYKSAYYMMYGRTLSSTDFDDSTKTK